MAEYLSIGEVAKLKNMTIETLRHYDRIGLLKPKFVNPKTSYRYYEMDQLLQIDIINYCKKINIPLNEIKVMFDTGNKQMFREFLDIQKQVICEEIKNMSHMLSRIEHLQSKMEQTEELGNQTSIYYKYIEARHIIYLPYTYEVSHPEGILTYSKIQDMIEEQNLINLYQGGFICGIVDENIQTKAVFETIKEQTEGDILYKTMIPEGQFMCLTYLASDREKSIKILKEAMDQKGVLERNIIDTYLIEGTFNKYTRKNELQVFLERTK